MSFSNKVKEKGSMSSMLFGGRITVAERTERDPRRARVGNGKRTVVGGRCYLPVSEVVLVSRRDAISRG